MEPRCKSRKNGGHQGCAKRLRVTRINPATITQGDQLTFIDLYAGCGGLSLGLMNAGLHGLFAVEKESRAFATLQHNLIMRQAYIKFHWPDWLPCKPIAVEDLLVDHRKNLESLRGKVLLLAGGPPCQGFSSNGRRIPTDPRNQAFQAYIQIVDVLCPSFVLMENVIGIAHPFRRRGGVQTGNHVAFSGLIQEALEDNSRDYKVWTEIVYSKDFGIPQTRPRFILIACKRYLLKDLEISPFEILRELAPSFLAQRGLKVPVSAEAAISDLRKCRTRLFASVDSAGYMQGGYGKQVSPFQILMHGELKTLIADSHRFAKHRPRTVEVFEWLQQNCRKGVGLRSRDRGLHSTAKHRVYILDPDAPAATVTSLPDDIIHYAEPRILTVREMARLQSFPDWFEFKGKYTTGGKVRVHQCPRYTQVANAVPPLLAEALGKALFVFRNRLEHTAIVTSTGARKGNRL
jgi:DNA (cytosine-5)-methyltransferase 1